VLVLFFGRNIPTYTSHVLLSLTLLLGHSSRKMLFLRRANRTKGTTATETEKPKANNQTISFVQSASYLGDKRPTYHQIRSRTGVSVSPCLC
jgi:hypothetical protein